ncbi:TonB-dependent receptor [Kordiimonas pumila]|uniref:TonB-dependent receptor n=1 Tax=Kordiimonas pumila TaxID=2161677 RepID=A0ABV7D5J4_9PROT|nr:TonB-dependent receptor [Kordiimonas pumila]
MTIIHNFWSSSSCLVGIAMASMTSTAYGQTETASETIGAFDEIVVTATRRAANIQDVAIAVTAHSGDRLIELGMRNTTDLAAMTPGLQFTAPGGPPVAGLISIRGVSQNDFAGHIEPANAFYIDEVYQPSNATSVQELFDVARVEVLKGPQGTLFGRNATGGLVHIVTNQPGDTLEGFVDVTVGSYDQVRVEAAVGGPIAEGVSARLAVLKNKADGFVKNDIGADLLANDTLAGRFQLKLEPNSALTVNLFADWYKNKPVASGGAMITGAGQDTDGLGIPLPAGSPTGFGYADADGDPYTGSYNYPGRFTRETWTVGGKANLDLGNGLSLATVTSYQKLDSEYAADNDFSPVDIGIFLQDADAKHFTQEIRLIEDEGAFRWTTGLYYLNIKGDYFQGFNLPAFATYPRADYSVDTQSYSGFGQIEYDLNADVQISAGIRVTRDEKDYYYSEVCTGPLCAAFIAPGSLAAAGVTTDNHGETGVSGRLAIDWHPNKDTLLYASINRGYKAFNYNAGFVGQAPLSGFRFKGENLMAYEVGGKFDLFDQHVRLNGSLYYYDYSDYQAFDQRGFNFTLFNTSAEIYGGDFELSIRPGMGFQFDAGLALLHTNVKDIPIGARIVDREAPQAPDYTINLAASKYFDLKSGKLSATFNAVYTADFYSQLTNAQVTLVPGGWLANARVSLEILEDRLELAVFANNIFDKARKTFSFDVSAPPLGGAYDTYTPPRWIGVEARLNF